MSDMSAEGTPRSPGRRRLLVGLAAAAGVAAIGGTAVVLGGRKSPEVIVTSPSPAITPATSQSTAPATQTATKPATPSPDLVDAAIKNGELRLNGEKDWEKYFIAITPEEARELLKANANASSVEDMKELLAFDPRKSPNLILKDAPFKLSTGESGKYLGVNNLAIGTTLYSSQDGNGLLGQDTQNLYFSLTGNGFINGFVIPKENSKSLAGSKQTMAIGNPVATIGVNKPSEFAQTSSIGDFQVLLTLGKGTAQKADSGSLKQLLIKNGKIAFLAQAA